MTRYNVKYDTCNSFSIKLQFFLLILLWFWIHIFVIKNYFGQPLKKFSQHVRLHGHAGVHFNVKSWSTKIEMGIFGEPKNHRVFLDHKDCKKINFSESRLYMAM